MIELILEKGEIVLSKDIVLFDELKKLFEVNKLGKKLVQALYYMHAVGGKNPFSDLDALVREESVFMAVFGKASLVDLKLSEKNLKLYKDAENLYEKYAHTAESRLERSINTKLDEISRMLDETVPTIEESVTKSGEVKYNSNLGIILNMFSKIDVIMKAKTTLQQAIQKKTNSGRVKGGGTSSFLEKGLVK